MSNFLHAAATDKDNATAKATAIPRVFSEYNQAKN